MKKVITQGATRYSTLKGTKIEYSVIVSDLFDGWLLDSVSYKFKNLNKAQEKFKEVCEIYNNKDIHYSPSWVA